MKILLIFGWEAFLPQLETRMLALDPNVAGECFEESGLCSAFDTSQSTYRELPWVYALLAPPVPTAQSHQTLLCGALQHVGPQKKGKFLHGCILSPECLVLVQTDIHAKQTAKRQNSFWDRIGMTGRKRGKQGKSSLVV